MAIRIALLLSLGLWACGDDDEPPPAAPGGTVLRPSGELQPWDLAPIVPVDSVRAMPPGTPLFLRTEFANGELADLEMTFIQVVDDFLQPMPVYMVEASDPVLIQLGGIARGMSGSPVFTEQGTWGAIAYGFSDQDSPPFFFFATPIEWVMGSRGGLPPVAKPAATWDGARITPLEVPLVSTGLKGSQLPGGSSFPLGEAVSAGLTQERQESFAAGRPLAVGLMLGEITGGSIGTISYVDGNRIYGFGHPFLGVGPVELPIIEAMVLGEISNLRAPFKFATLNPTVRGILTEDRLPAVRGVLGEEPELVPVRSTYTFSSGSEIKLTHRIATAGLGDIPISLVATAFFRPLVNRIEDEPDHSIRVTAKVSFAGTDSVISRTRLYADPYGNLYSSIRSADNDLSSGLAELMTRNDLVLQISEAEVHVEVIPEPRFAKVMAVSADTVVRPGSTLSITTSLRVGRRLDREIELELTLPDTIPSGFYRLEVGSAADLDDPEEGFGGLAGLGLMAVDNRAFQEDEETLEDVFARLNAADENVVLKARLIPAAPDDPSAEPGEPNEESGGVFGDLFGDVGLSEPVSVEKVVDLRLEGTRSIRLELVDED